MQNGAAALNLWLDGYEKKTRDKGLRPETERQWALGNRGRKGKWIEEKVAHG